MLQIGNPYYTESEILMRKVIDNKQGFQTIVSPRFLVTQLLRLAHNELGHNSTTKTSIVIRRLYYWKGLKVNANKHIK